jgi:hypothetical protein
MEGVTMATVREIDGQIVLEDPFGLAVLKAVGKHNCRLTFEGQAERVAHFKRRIAERGVSPDDVVITLVNVDDVNGGPIADVLMPGQEAMWQEFRAAGQVPFARGLAGRQGVQAMVTMLDAEAGEKLRAMVGKAAVVVVDHGVVEVFEA